MLTRLPNVALAALLLLGSLVAGTMAGVGRLGLAVVCGISGLGFGLNVWRLRDALLDELQAQGMLATGRRRLVTRLLGAAGVLLVVVAIVIFFTVQPGPATH